MQLERYMGPTILPPTHTMTSQLANVYCLPCGHASWELAVTFEFWASTSSHVRTSYAIRHDYCQQVCSQAFCSRKKLPLPW